jgi:hypothetical protein
LRKIKGAASRVPYTSRRITILDGLVPDRRPGGGTRAGRRRRARPGPAAAVARGGGGRRRHAARHRRRARARRPGKTVTVADAIDELDGAAARE